MPIVDVEGYEDAAATNRERLVRGKLADALAVSSRPRYASTYRDADVSYASQSLLQILRFKFLARQV